MRCWALRSSITGSTAARRRAMPLPRHSTSAMQTAELAAAPPSILQVQLNGPGQRPCKHLFEPRIGSDIAADVADRPAEAGGQEWQFAVAALELRGGGIATGHQGRPLGGPNVRLPPRQQPKRVWPQVRGHRHRQKPQTNRTTLLRMTLIRNTQSKTLERQSTCTSPNWRAFPRRQAPWRSRESPTARRLREGRRRGSAAGDRDNRRRASHPIEHFSGNGSPDDA